MQGMTEEADPTAGLIRIGELSRRVDASPHLLRVWERRYGVLRPTRTQGGFRLYSLDDERRVRLMQRLLGEGYSHAAAARLALREPTDADELPPPGPHAPPQDGVRELGDALESFDEVAGQRILDRALASQSLDAVLEGLVLPYLRDLGERWHRGETTIAQEHFASSVVRGRLIGLARGWDTGTGPRAILACPPGERHDIGLIAFGLALRARGWRITFLGQDTPLEGLADLVEELHPAAVVLAAIDPARLEDRRVELTIIGHAAPLLLSGPGAGEELAAAVGGRYLDGGPVEAAALVAAEA